MSRPPPLFQPLPPTGEALLDVYPSRGGTVAVAVWDDRGEVIAVTVSPAAARELAVHLVRVADLAARQRESAPPTLAVRRARVSAKSAQNTRNP